MLDTTSVDIHHSKVLHQSNDSVLQYLEIFSKVLSFYITPLYESSDEHQGSPFLIVFDVEKEVEVLFIHKAFEATQGHGASCYADQYKCEVIMLIHTLNIHCLLKCFKTLMIVERMYTLQICDSFS
jgi:hypothetical protein